MNLTSVTCGAVESSAVWARKPTQPLIARIPAVKGKLNKPNFSYINCTDWLFSVSVSVQFNCIRLLWCLCDFFRSCSNEGSVFVLELLALSPLQPSSGMDVSTHEHEGREEEEAK